MPLKDHIFSAKQFEKMLINPFSIELNVDLYERFKAVLGKYVIFKPYYPENYYDATPAERAVMYNQANIDKFGHQDISNNKVLRFLAYFYDKDCPLENVISDYKERKIVAAELAGFNIEGGDFTKPFSMILDGRHKIVNMMAIYFLRLFNDMSYATLKTLVDKYFTEVLMRGDTKEIRDTSKAIDGMTKEFLSRESNYNVEETLWSVVNKELAELESMRPEGMLDKMLNAWQKV